MSSRKHHGVYGICLVLMVVGLTLSIACAASAQTPKAKNLKVGIILSVTGPGSEAEKEERQGVFMARDWINSKGGVTIKGEKYFIDLIHEDSKATVEGAVAAATKLVTRDEVKFVIGLSRPDMAIAIHSITEPAKVIKVITFGAGAPGLISAKTPYTFRGFLCGAEAIPTHYNYLVQAYPNVKTVAMIASDDPGGKFFIGYSEKVAESKGLTKVFKELYPFGTEDFYPLWSKILATKPDALDAGVAYRGTIISILKQGRELGYTGPIMHQSSGELFQILQGVGKEFATDFFNGSFDVKNPPTPTLKLMAKLGGGELKGAWVGGWDCLWGLVQAIEKAQSLDTTQIATTWEKMEKIETAFGIGHMGGLKTYGINHLVVRPLPISRLEKGNIEFVNWFMPEFP
jgi:branched-chain amino acid transport system substrate-binding protein